MRQAGILAAAALYALEHHIERLAEDHANASAWPKASASVRGITIDPAEVETNIVIFDIDPRLGTGATFAANLKDAGVWMLANGPQKVRAVTHLDVTGEQIDEALVRIGRIVA